MTSLRSLRSSIRFGRTPTGGVAAPPDPMEPIEEDQPFEVDFNAVDSASTYSALSSFLRIWKRAGGRKPSFIPKKVILKLYDTCDEKNIDISDVDEIPYDAPDLNECLVLLGRLQNQGANKGATRKGDGSERYSTSDLVRDTLLDREGKGHRYDIGEYVEVLGDSMSWSLQVIQNVLKTRDDDGEHPIFVYETDRDHGLAVDKIRLPTEALVKVFGLSPLIWQQWACLRLENKICFDEGSQMDFEFFDIIGYVNDLWRVWLMDDRNKTFRDLYDRAGKSGQEELMKNIMGPFELMNLVVTNENEDWDLEDAGISIFTYISLLGSGFLDGFAVFVLQVSIPIFLALYYSGRRDDNDNDEKIAVGTRPMLFALLLYYLFKVSRDVRLSFNNVVGVTDEVYSKIQSLRKIVWENGNDSFAQSLGYTSDQFMNTGYICALYMFNIWILFNVGDPFELLGSVIFFEFLFDLDEDVASSDWWDKGNRFLKAGCVGLIMQATIQQEHTFSRESYFEKYGKNLDEDFKKENMFKMMDDAGIPSGRGFLACQEDVENMELLTMEERVSQNRLMDSNASVAHITETQPNVFFSGILGSDSAMFQRHKKLRAWTQWEKFLFLFPTPTLVPEDYISGTKLDLDEDQIHQDTSLNRKSFNISILDDFVRKTKKQHFWHQVYRVLSLKEFDYSDNSESTRKNVGFSVSRHLYAILIWLSFVLELLFPVYVVGALICVYLPVNGKYSFFYCSFNVGEFCDFASGGNFL